MGATQPQHEYDMEDESAGVRGEVENLVDASEPGPLTQMLQDSQGTGGGDGLNKGKREEVVVDKLGEVEVEGLGEGKGASVEGELSEEGSQGGESGEDSSEDEEGGGEQKEKGGWEKQGRRGRARRRAKRRKQAYSDIGEDGMSRSRSSSGKRRARRVQTLSPSPRRLHGGGTGERNESAGGLDSQVAISLIPTGQVSKGPGKR